MNIIPNSPKIAAKKTKQCCDCKGKCSKKCPCDNKCKKDCNACSDGHMKAMAGVLGNLFDISSKLNKMGYSKAALKALAAYDDLYRNLDVSDYDLKDDLSGLDYAGSKPGELSFRDDFDDPEVQQFLEPGNKIKKLKDINTIIDADTSKARSINFKIDKLVRYLDEGRAQEFKEKDPEFYFKYLDEALRLLNNIRGNFKENRREIADRSTTVGGERRNDPDTVPDDLFEKGDTLKDDVFVHASKKKSRNKYAGEFLSNDELAEQLSNRSFEDDIHDLMKELNMTDSDLYSNDLDNYDTEEFEYDVDLDDEDEDEDEDDGSIDVDFDEDIKEASRYYSSILKKSELEDIDIFRDDSETDPDLFDSAGDDIFNYNDPLDNDLGDSDVGFKYNDPLDDLDTNSDEDEELEDPFED